MDGGKKNGRKLSYAAGPVLDGLHGRHETLPGQVFRSGDCRSSLWRWQFQNRGGYDSGDGSTDTRKWNRFGQLFDRYKHQNLPGVARQGQIPPRDVERTGGTWEEKYGKKIIAWDVAPGKEYFDELFRVSRDQIIWGGNYFDLPPTRCFLVWRKLTISENFSMAMAEYAWTSFTGNAKVFEAAPQGTANETRFHPTQKPVALYQWILSRYAKPGMKILDTHAGSATSLVACHRAGFDQAWGFEIDPTYFKKAKDRLDKEKAQITIFDIVKEEEQCKMD